MTNYPPHCYNDYFYGFQSKETFFEGELGAHFVYPLIDNLHISAGGALGYAQRVVDFSQKQYNAISRRWVVFDHPNTTSIIRPSALLSLTQSFTDQVNASLFSRAHHAIFADNGLIQEDPTMIDLGVQFKGESKKTSLGLYCQGLLRGFLRGSAEPKTPERLSRWNPSPTESSLRPRDPMIPSDMLRSAGRIVNFEVSCGLTLKLN